MSQESKKRLTGSFASISPMCLQLRSAWAIVISRFDWERIWFPTHSCGCWQDLVLYQLLNWKVHFLAACCWLELLINSLSCRSLHRAAHNMAVGFINMRVLAKQKSQSWMTVSEVTSHYSCGHILLIRSESASGSSHTQGEITQGCEHQGGNDWEHLRGCLPLPPLGF